MEVGPAPFPHSGHPELLATREGPILHLADTAHLTLAPPEDPLPPLPWHDDTARRTRWAALKDAAGEDTAGEPRETRDPPETPDALDGRAAPDA